MTRRRWIADEVSGNSAALVGEHANHLVRVLRARVGQDFDIATGDFIRRGQIVSITDSRIEFELGEEIPTRAAAEITLLLAVFKFDRMEWAIEKCTELGVARLVPLVARRTDSHLAAAAKKRAERWKRIAHQAAEQSRRFGPPDISEPLNLTEALKISARLRIVLSEFEDQTQLRDTLKAEETSDKVALAVGPEGGWTQDELQLFEQAGWISASLGNTILRSETAAIAATAVVAAALYSR